jgi:hypothetical protein
MFYVLVRRQPSAQPLSTAATDLKTLQKHRNKFRSLILIVRGLNSVFQFFFLSCPPNIKISLQVLSSLV